MNPHPEQLTVGQGLVEMVQPSVASTAAFVVIVTGVGCALLGCVANAYRDAGRRAPMLTGLAYGAVLVLTYGLAASGTFSLLAGQRRGLVYPMLTNLLALGAALSPFGRRLATATPLWALVLVQAFRLPLELVLHRWWQEGVIPIQMTYAGDNWDIATGLLALLLGLVLLRTPAAVGKWIAAGFSLVGLALLVRVTSIAVRSLPGPLRAYPNDPPVLLPFHAPYTWILPACVSAALFFHILLVRKLLAADPIPLTAAPHPTDLLRAGD